MRRIGWFPVPHYQFIIEFIVCESNPLLLRMRQRWSRAAERTSYTGLLAKPGRLSHRLAILKRYRPHMKDETWRRLNWCRSQTWKQTRGRVHLH